jgi:hypothetical protein
VLNAALLLLGIMSTDADSVLKRGKAVPASGSAMPATNGAGSSS